MPKSHVFFVSSCSASTLLLPCHARPLRGGSVGSGAERLGRGRERRRRPEEAAGGVGADAAGDGAGTGAKAGAKVGAGTLHKTSGSLG